MKRLRKKNKLTKLEERIEKKSNSLEYNELELLDERLIIQFKWQIPIIMHDYYTKHRVTSKFNLLEMKLELPDSKGILCILILEIFVLPYSSCSPFVKIWFRSHIWNSTCDKWNSKWRNSLVSSEIPGVTPDSTWEGSINEKVVRLVLKKLKKCEIVNHIRSNKLLKKCKINLVQLAKILATNPFKYLFTMVDHFSKYAWARWIPKKEKTITLIKALECFF